jgi:hypothetical protein
MYPLTGLHLDTSNPRFGEKAGQISSEQEVLNAIVEEYGIEDILSSIAVNGFFQSEPLVGTTDGASPRVRIVEGNRRLAACLILAGDPRAKSQASRTTKYSRIQEERGREPITQVPVIVYQSSEWNERFFPYLGVRHIVGARKWDSYAKAAWIAGVTEQGRLDLAEVIEMIGDDNRTSARILEGYYFVQQLSDTGHYTGKESQRPGRGSCPDFPFSWVYTALGYKPIRDWVGLPASAGIPKKNSIPEDRLGNAALLMKFLFGEKSKGRSPVVPDSRDIGSLSACVRVPSRVRLLEVGHDVRQVDEESRPPQERVRTALLDTAAALQKVWTLLGENAVSPQDSHELLVYCEDCKVYLTNIMDKLRGLIPSEGGNE